MKLAYHYLLFSLLTLLIMSSCELETSNNGKIDGYWKLNHVDTLATGGQTDLNSKNLFWSFQGKLLSLRDRNEVHNPYIARFDYQNDQLHVYDIHLDDRTQGDKLVEDIAVLSVYGIVSKHETYTIEQLTHSEMILSNATYRLRFEKY